jgi:hypothetical protein
VRLIFPKAATLKLGKGFCIHPAKQATETLSPSILLSGSEFQVLIRFLPCPHF